MHIKSVKLIDTELPYVNVHPRVVKCWDQFVEPIRKRMIHCVNFDDKVVILIEM